MSTSSYRTYLGHALISLILLGSAAEAAKSVAVKAAVQNIDEVVDVMARISGRKLSRVGKHAVGKQLQAAALQHGDSVLKAARKGGLELTEAAARHGDDVWRFAVANPAAARQLATRADDLLPLARRIGPEVLELEAKRSGISSLIVRQFGDDAVRTLAKAPSQDLPVLLGYAARANDPAAKAALLTAYKSTGGTVLKNLKWEQIMAGGLSVSMVTAAYQLSDSGGKSMEIIAEQSPEIFAEIIGEKMVSPLITVLQVFAAVIAAAVALKFCLWLRPWYSSRRRSVRA